MVSFKFKAIYQLLMFNGKISSLLIPPILISINICAWMHENSTHWVLRSSNGAQLSQKKCKFSQTYIKDHHICIIVYFTAVGIWSSDRTTSCHLMQMTSWLASSLILHTWWAFLVWCIYRCMCIPAALNCIKRHCVLLLLMVILASLSDADLQCTRDETTYAYIYISTKYLNMYVGIPGLYVSTTSNRGINMWISMKIQESTAPYTVYLMCLLCK